MRGPTAWALAIACILPSAVRAQEPAPDDLEGHLAARQRQVDDPNLSLEQRAQIALEMSATLDRAAQAATSAEVRRAQWGRAIALLDAFNQKEPVQPDREAFALQAAVYTWAQAQSWIQQAELNPSDRQARAKAIAGFDSAVSRLRRISAVGTPEAEALEQNQRYRLAQALADRARYEDSGLPETRQRELEEALKALGHPFTDPALDGFAHLLQADLLTRLGRLDQAQAELRRAKRVKPAPPAPALLQAEVQLALSRKAFDEALRLIDAAHIEPAERDLLSLRVHLAQRAAASESGERAQAEARAFRTAQALQKADRPELRQALIELAKEIPEPDDDEPAGAWDLLGEGFLAMGDWDKASSLIVRGAERADRDGQHEQAAALRTRAGAILFQAGRFARADALLTGVFNDRKAGSVRAKAGMLRVLARARGLAAGKRELTREQLIEALEAQLREFPDDLTAGETRWLLGNLRLQDGQRDEAIELWKGVPRGDAHWLEAHKAVAGVRQQDLEAQLISGDRAESRRKLNEVARFLISSRAETSQPSDRIEIDLCRARLELTPVAGRAETALEICDRILKASSTVDQRLRTERLRIVALAQLGRFVDAETDTREVAASSSPGELLGLARLLDSTAKFAEADLYRRRLGLLMRIVLGRALEHPEALSPADRTEAQLRLTRGLLFNGDYDGARRSLQNSASAFGTLPDALLDDLADTYIRLDAFALAVDVYRLQAQHCHPGSPAWFGARYGQALAFYRSGKPEEARRLIDATAILHPELGGAELREKFERLRQRIRSD